MVSAAFIVLFPLPSISVVNVAGILLVLIYLRLIHLSCVFNKYLARSNRI